MSKIWKQKSLFVRYSEIDFTKKKDKYVKYSLSDLAEVIESTIKTTRASTMPSKK